jgi:hypothetical protein
MSKLIDWIVYRTPEGVTEAVKLDLTDSYQVSYLSKEGNVVLGFPAAGTKTDALDYMDQVLRG